MFSARQFPNMQLFQVQTSNASQLLSETIFNKALFSTEVWWLRKCFSSPGLRTLCLAQIDTRLTYSNSPLWCYDTRNVDWQYKPPLMANAANGVGIKVYISRLIEHSTSKDCKSICYTIDCDMRCNFSRNFFTFAKKISKWLWWFLLRSAPNKHVSFVPESDEWQLWHLNVS